MIEVNNILASIPETLQSETFESLLETGRMKLERILSHGHATRTGHWYDQEWDEWVLLLRGRAGLKFEDPAEDIELRSGDYLLIPAHRRHRVEWTDADEKCVWLALHFEPEGT